MSYDELIHEVRNGTYHEIVDAEHPATCEADGCDTYADIGFESPDDVGMIAVFTCEHHAEKVIDL